MRPVSRSSMAGTASSTRMDAVLNAHRRTLDAEERGCQFTLALSRSEEEAMLAAVAEQGVEAVIRPFAAIDCQRAQATQPKDLTKILQAVQSGPGYDTLSRKWLLRLPLAP